MEPLKRNKVRVLAQCDDVCYTDLVGSDVRLSIADDLCRLGIDLNCCFHKSRDARTNGAAKHLADAGSDRLVALTIADALFVRSLRSLDLPAIWTLEIELRDRWPAIEVEPVIRGDEIILWRTNSLARFVAEVTAMGA